MCGVWVVMEDIDGINGVLEYYLGSYLLLIYVNEYLGVCFVI